MCFPLWAKASSTNRLVWAPAALPLISKLHSSISMFLEQNPVLSVRRCLRARESGHPSELQCASSSHAPHAVLDARDTVVNRADGILPVQAQAPVCVGTVDR